MGRRERQQATGSGLGSQGHLSQVCVEGVAPCRSPASIPTSHIGASDPALVSQLLAQGYGSRNNKIDITVDSKLLV
jgi:hypothetical protein